MKKKVIFFPQVTAQEIAGSNRSRVPRLNRSGLREVYDLVVGSLSESFWMDSPELSLQHGLTLGQSIRESFPMRQFVERNYRYQRRHPEVDPVPVALADALEGTSRAIDIYVRRFVEVDFTAPLIDASTDFDQATHIAWIREELSVLEHREITGSPFPFSPHDRVFAFCSPSFAWEHGFGRCGLIVIRGRQIVDCHLVEAS